MPGYDHVVHDPDRLEGPASISGEGPAIESPAKPVDHGYGGSRRPLQSASQSADRQVHEQRAHCSGTQPGFPTLQHRDRAEVWREESLKPFFRPPPVVVRDIVPGPDLVYRRQRRPVRMEHARYFGCRALMVLEVLEDLCADGKVEGAVTERQSVSAPEDVGGCCCVKIDSSEVAA